MASLLDLTRNLFSKGGAVQKITNPIVSYLQNNTTLGRTYNIARNPSTRIIAREVAKPATDLVGGSLGTIKHGFNYLRTGNPAEYQAQMQSASRAFGSGLENGKFKFTGTGAPALAAQAYGGLSPYAKGFALTSGGLGAVGAKFSGRDVAQGIGQGINSGLQTAGLVNLTNPYIGKALSKLPIKAPQVVQNRLAPAIGNVVQGIAINKAQAMPTTLGGVAFDAATGLLGGKGQFSELSKVDDLLKQGKALGFEGISPRVSKIYPDDLDVMRQFADEVLRRKGAKKDLGELGVSAQRLAEHYFGGDWKYADNKKLAKAFEWAIDLNMNLPREVRGAVPKANLVNYKNVSGSKVAQLEEPVIRGDITKLKNNLDEILGVDSMKVKGGRKKGAIGTDAYSMAKKQLEYYAESGDQDAAKLLLEVERIERELGKAQIGEPPKPPTDPTEALKTGKDLAADALRSVGQDPGDAYLSSSQLDQKYAVPREVVLKNEIDDINSRIAKLSNNQNSQRKGSATQVALEKLFKQYTEKTTELQDIIGNQAKGVAAPSVPSVQKILQQPLSQDSKPSLEVIAPVKPVVNQATKSPLETAVTALSKKLETPLQKVEVVQQAAQQKLGTSQRVPSLDDSIRSSNLDVKSKVNILDYLRTPDRVLQKLGLGNEAEAIKNQYNKYLDELPAEIGKVTSWYERVGKSQEASKRIFKYLDGQDVKLQGEELKVATEMKQYLSTWADKLNLPEDSRIANYITHIFEKDFIQKEFDQDLAKLIQDKVPGSVYDPFLEKRLGKLGYVEDAFRAMDAYVKRATRKYNMDPALEQLKAASSKLDLDSWNYVKSYADRINLRPTNVDNLVDTLIKQTPVGYKLGARPISLISRNIRQMIYRGTLGLNIGSAVRNLTQGVNTYAQLGEKYTGIGYVKAIKSIATNSSELEDAGVLRNSFIEDRTLSATKKAWENLDKGLFSVFEMAEKINRGAAYFGAKAQALSSGKSEQEAIKAGVEMARKTQFTFGSVDTPVAMQSDITKLLTQFQSFNVKQTEFLADMVKNKQFGGLVRWLGANIVILATVGQAMGWDWKDMVPFGGVADGQSPLGNSPAFTLGKDALALATGGTDKYGNKIEPKQLAKDLIPLIPGGVQINKTVGGLKDVIRGSEVTNSGKVKFSIAQTPQNYLQAGLLGSYNLPEAQRYRIKQSLPKTDTGEKYLISEDTPIGAKRTLVNAESLAANPVETINLWMKGEPIKKVTLSGDNPIEQAKNFFGAITVSERASVSSLDHNDKSTQVDHIKSKWLGGREEVSNYQILTNEEHAQKTALDNELLKQFKAGDITKEEAWQQLQEFNKSLHGKPISQKQLDNLAVQVSDKALTEDSLAKYTSGGGATVAERANWVKQQLDSFTGTAEEKQQFINDLWDKKIITGTSRGVAAYLKQMGVNVYTSKSGGSSKKTSSKKITVKTPSLKSIKLTSKQLPSLKIKAPPKQSITAYKPKNILTTVKPKQYNFSGLGTIKNVSGGRRATIRAKR